MVKNELNKKSIKKDGNVEMKNMIKDVKKSNVIMDNEDYRASLVRIMDNQEKAQNSLVSIVDAMFEMAGLNAPSFDNKRFKAMASYVCTEECLKDFLEMQKNEEEKFNTVMQRNFNGLDWVITVYEDTVNNFNANATEEEKQSLFIQCILALSYVNYTDRLGFIDMLIKQTVETKCKIESGRSWMLANMLMIPEIAA